MERFNFTYNVTIWPKHEIEEDNCPAITFSYMLGILFISMMLLLSFAIITVRLAKISDQTDRLKDII